MDVITDYAFNRSYNLLQKRDLGAQFFALVRGVGPVFWIFQQLTFMPSFVIKVPPWLANKASKPLAQVNRLKSVYSPSLAISEDRKLSDNTSI